MQVCRQHRRQRTSGAPRRRERRQFPSSSLELKMRISISSRFGDSPMALILEFKLRPLGWQNPRHCHAPFGKFGGSPTGRAEFHYG